MFISVREARRFALLLPVVALAACLFIHWFSMHPYYNHASYVPIPYDSKVQSFDPRLRWKDGQPPPIITFHKVPGFTVFKNLYIYNHTFYVVTTKFSSIPDPCCILSNGFPSGPSKGRENQPTSRTLSVITPSEAKLLFGSFAGPIEDITVGIALAVLV